ncbi:hypothetical protein [Terasakiella pusilla]|uniref:hypothetical protein n=1 Tax=Terasakiella pusilla TaxID=64973 RepID=UPI003AA84532
MSINKLPKVSTKKEIDPDQPELDLCVEKETEYNGIGMGVLSDGTPFLHQRGLAALCDVKNAHIGTISSDWSEEQQKPRISKIKDLLSRRGVTVDSPHTVLKHGGRTIYAYPDSVCIAILEYYAFEAGENCKELARDNFRILAGEALRTFIYTQVGYDPNNMIPTVWKQFHDRVSLNYDSVPPGYFSIYKEMADIIVTLIQGGAKVGSEFVPDISMGQHWGKHWNKGNLEARFGARVQYIHHYPDDFPQAASNPQTPWAYPEAALPEFRKWVREVYIPEKLPPFLKKKEAEGQLPPSFAQVAVSALEAKAKGNPVITQGKK